MILFLQVGKIQGQDNYSWHGHEIVMSHNYDQDSMTCLAKNIYFESANQSFAGRLAVAHVVMNRKASDLFPDEICGVVYQAKTMINWKGNEVPIKNQCQFSWYCDGKSDDIPLGAENWVKAQMVAWEMMHNGTLRGISDGSTHYHATYVKPIWRKDVGMALVGRIGSHIFYRWN
jgi:spore germination cell wall hydrolase CwlJ-like protein